MKGFLRAVVDGYLLPRVCPVCHRELLEDYELMCLSCMSALPLCRRSGRMLMRNTACMENSRVPVVAVDAWMDYDPHTPYASLIRYTKYAGRPSLGRALGRAYARDRLLYGGDAAVTNVDVLLPMAMHISRRLLRGYNQAAAIAAGIADVTGAVVADNLYAVRPHNSQVKLSGSGRAVNLSGTMAVHHPEELEGLRVGIVDDIITTGASVGEAIMTISRDAPGVASISVLAIGATVGQ